MGSPRDWMETVKETVKRIKALIGSPADTGGSATAGTLMGKENYIIEQLEPLGFHTKLPEWSSVSEKRTIAQNAKGTFNLTLPEGAYFSSVEISQGYMGDSDYNSVTIEIEGKTHYNQAKAYYTEYSFQMGGLEVLESGGTTMMFPKLENRRITVVIENKKSERDITVYANYFTL